MIAAPPFAAGAVQLSATCRSPAVPANAVGAPGTVIGVTGADGSDCGPVPAALTAATLNVYAVPLVKPLNV